MELTKENLLCDIGNGMTIMQLSDKYLVSVSAMWRKLRKYGLKTKTYNDHEEKKKRCIELLKSGMTNEEIANELNCTCESMTIYIKNHKLGGYRKKKVIQYMKEVTPDGKGVLCKSTSVSKVKRKCLYGGKCGNHDCCDYLLMTGKLREFDKENPEICYCYVHATDEMKRQVADIKWQQGRDVLMG